MAKLKGISRIDQKEKRNHGWYARVEYGDKKVAKWFADKKNGGKKPAYEAAARWVRAAHTMLSKPYTRRRVVIVPTSSTKEVGITQDRYGYLVTWTSGKNKNLRSYVAKSYGLASAKKMRRRRAQQMYKEAAL
jgi:hypothetical protein